MGTLSGGSVEKPFSAYRGDEPYVFVCYGHEDSEFVFREIAWLNDYGINVWYDEGISPGHEWSDELARAIQGCTKVLYFVTPNSVASEHCRRELNFAQEEGREVVAIHLEATEVPAGLRLVLNNRQAILKHELSEDEFHKRLIRVAHGSGKPAAALGAASVDKGRGSKAGLAFTALAVIAVVIGVVWYLTREAVPVEGDLASSVEDTATPMSEVLPNSVAVLPFENLSPDPNNAYFAAGMHEEVLNQLSKVKDLSVIARATMVRYENSGKSIPAIGAELKVRTVMSGSVRYARDRVRISTQLIDAASGEQIWSEAYEESVQDVFGVQLDIATKIASILEARLSTDEKKRLANRPTGKPEAYAEYLRAADAWGSFRGIQIVHDALDRAIGIDPEFAAAFAFKSAVSAFQANFGVAFYGPTFSEEQQNQLLRMAEENARRALSLDDREALAHVAMAVVHYAQRNWRAGYESAQRAYELNPNHYFVLNLMAWRCKDFRQAEECVDLAHRGVALNPGDMATPGNISAFFYSIQHWREAERYAKVEIAALPNAATGYVRLAAALLRLGNEEETRRNLALAEARNPGIFETASIAFMYSTLGDTEKAFRIFEGSAAGDESAVPSLDWHFFMHLAVGEYDAALEYLERAVEIGFPFGFLEGLRFYPEHPNFDSIRSHPKFSEIVEQVKAPLHSKR
jgi:TolB-like protein/Tfp pilus assembly protein PilF